MSWSKVRKHVFNSSFLVERCWVQYRETQCHTMSIDWVALSSFVSLLSHLVTSPFISTALYDVLDHTKHIFSESLSSGDDNDWDEELQKDKYKDTQTQTKTETKCFKDLIYAIFSESRGLKDFDYGNFHQKLSTTSKMTNFHSFLCLVCKGFININHISPHEGEAKPSSSPSRLSNRPGKLPLRAPTSSQSSSSPEK